jgi:hypothetical protein
MGVQLAVLEGGVRMPVIPVSQPVPVAEEQPISPALPEAPAPVVPVYPRKQARH